jgi:hypothetical protein
LRGFTSSRGQRLPAASSQERACGGLDHVGDTRIRELYRGWYAGESAAEAQGCGGKINSGTQSEGQLYTGEKEGEGGRSLSDAQAKRSITK